MLVGAAGFEPTTSCSQIRPTTSQLFIAVRNLLQLLQFRQEALSSHHSDSQFFATILLPPCFHGLALRTLGSDARSYDPCRQRAMTYLP
jgi:hypothetical protein